MPIVLAANKCDLEEERQVDTGVGEEFARLSNAYYIETRYGLDNGGFFLLCSFIALLRGNMEVNLTCRYTPFHADNVVPWILTFFSSFVTFQRC